MQDKLIGRIENNVPSSTFSTPRKHSSWPFGGAAGSKRAIRAIATQKKGLTREEILVATKSASGGTLSTRLDELISSGFVERIQPIYDNDSQAPHPKQGEPLTNAKQLGKDLMESRG